MRAKPERDFFGDNEVKYLYGVLRIEKMVLILNALLQSPGGLPQKESEWDREKTKYYGDFTASGLVHEISCLVKNLDNKDKNALTELLHLAKDGLELRRTLKPVFRQADSQSYPLEDCFEVLPSRLGHSVQRMAVKLDDFELNWLKIFVLFAGGELIDKRKLNLIQSL